MVIVPDDFRWHGMTWSCPATDCEDWKWSYIEGTNLNAERYSLAHVLSPSTHLLRLQWQPIDHRISDVFYASILSQVKAKLNLTKQHHTCRSLFSVHDNKSDRIYIFSSSKGQFRIVRTGKLLQAPNGFVDEHSTERSGRKTAWAGAEWSGLNRPLKFAHTMAVEVAFKKPRFLGFLKNFLNHIDRVNHTLTLTTLFPVPDLREGPGGPGPRRPSHQQEASHQTPQFFG